MGRVAAVIFASQHPVPRQVLAVLIGLTCHLDLLIEDIRDELAPRPTSLVVYPLEIKTSVRGRTSRRRAAE
jgi:segregation and condensation protein B